MADSPQEIRLDERAVHLLRRRRRARFVFAALLLAILAAITAARVRSQPAATDHDRYHQHHFRVLEALGGDLLRLADGEGERFDVRLIGVDAHGSEPARERADGIRGQQVMLYLEPVPTRNHAGEVLAYVYSGDVLLNARFIEEGLAFADRRWDYSFARQFFQLEEQAQSRRRGIWADMTESHMPEWRQRWLAEMKRQPWERREWRREDEP